MGRPREVIHIAQPGWPVILAFEIAIWVVGSAVRVEAAWEVEAADRVDGGEGGEFGVFYGCWEAGF
jgi:hypothetical protein